MLVDILIELLALVWRLRLYERNEETVTVMVALGNSDDGESQEPPVPPAAVPARSPTWTSHAIRRCRHGYTAGAPFPRAAGQPPRPLSIDEATRLVRAVVTEGYDADE